MGYRSDVTIICGQKAYELLYEVCVQHDFVPTIKQDGEFYVFLWEWERWYEEDAAFPEVQAVVEVLHQLDKTDAEDVAYAYKQFIFGEYPEDNQIRYNTAGERTLYDYYMQRKVAGFENDKNDFEQAEEREVKEMQKVGIQYLDDTIERLCYVDGKSDWIDLRAAEDVTMVAGEFKLIPLGVAMQLPKGYEAHIVPRSSTYKNFGIIQTNHIGIVDNSYCGSSDWWYMPAYALRDTEIHKNDRICQFRIMENQPKLVFEETVQLEGKNRGGIGSTGIQ